MAARSALTGNSGCPQSPSSILLMVGNGRAPHSTIQRDGVHFRRFRAWGGRSGVIAIPGTVGIAGKSPGHRQARPDINHQVPGPVTIARLNPDIVLTEPGGDLAEPRQRPGTVTPARAECGHPSSSSTW